MSAPISIALRAFKGSLLPILSVFSQQMLNTDFMKVALGSTALAVTTYVAGPTVLRAGFAVLSRVFFSCYGRELVDMTKTAAIASTKQNTRYTPGLTRALTEAVIPGERVTKSVAEGIISDIILSSGLERMDVNPSQAVHQTHDNSHLYYMNKDLALKPSLTKLHENHIITMVDVDYYVDLPKYLSLGLPILIYTFCPIKPAGISTKTSYTTTDNAITQRYPNGVTYTHYVWHHEGSRYVLSDATWFLGRRFVFEVTIRRISDERCFVLYRPMLSINNLITPLLEQSYLTRMRISYGEGATAFNAIRCVSPEGEDLIYLNAAGTTVSIPFRAADLSMLPMRSAFSHKELVYADIQMLLKPQTNIALSVTLAYAFARTPNSFNLCQQQILMPSDKIPQFSDEHSYRFTSRNTEDPFKPTMHQVMAPIIKGAAFAPMRCPANTKATIVGRVQNIRNTTMPSPFVLKCLEEFIKFVVPDDIAHCLTPLSVQDTIARQNRPTQRSLYEAAINRLDAMRTNYQCFQKAEAYLKITDPRNIVNPSVDHRVKYATILYAFTDHVMKSQRWYAFGKPPSEFTDELVRLAQSNPFLDEGDFSRFDGTQGPIQTLVLLAILKRAFSLDHHDFIDECLQKQTFAPAYCDFNVKFNTKWITISGSADTSARNTLNNAFCAYVANRMSKRRGFEPTAQEAFDQLGLYGGDDSINTAFTSVNIVDAARMLGLKLTNKIVESHKHLTFLGRIYLNPWTTRACIADIYKALARFHLSATNPVNAALTIIHRRKAESWLVTDPKTPVIGDLCRLILRQTAPLTERQLRATQAEVGFWSRNADNCPFDAPADDFESDLAYSVCAEELQIDVQTIKDFENDLRTKKLNELAFPNIPSRAEPMSEYEYICGDVVYNYGQSLVEDKLIAYENETNPETDDHDRDAVWKLHEEMLSPPATVKKKETTKTKGPVDKHCQKSPNNNNTLPKNAESSKGKPQKQSKPKQQQQQIKRPIRATPKRKNTQASPESSSRSTS